MSNTINPLLAKVKLPGKVFQLPSKGVFYEPGVLADSVRNAEIQVKPMSAMIELKIRSADLLLSTKIIQEICQECAPEILKPEMLVSQDVDALFIFLVMATYGNLKTIKAMHNCQKAEVHDYQVDLDPIVSNPRNSVLDHKDMLYQVDLDNGQSVKLKPVLFTDSVDMVVLRQQLSLKELKDPASITSDEVESIVLRDLMAVIDSVSDGQENPTFVSDKNMIRDWLRALSKPNIDRITEASVRSSEWGFNTRVNLKCKDCGSNFVHEMELNPISFFSQ